ncbi:hypothetical protein AB9F29_14035 [Falsihalocynthiibacter sp. S25ZX9]|uniref:hypothetical protein n=1 Tax=Falsihalocynthiibacter sp. S25ZX9 TaxID=3240870 RepID=UPI00350EC75C
MFRIGGFWARLSLTVLAVAVLSACVPNETETPAPAKEAPLDNSDLYPDTRFAKSIVLRMEPYFPFGIQKTCGDEYPRLRLANVQESPEQGNISLWETNSKTVNTDRYVLWYAPSACGFLVETPADDDEGPFSTGGYILLDDMGGGITHAGSATISVEGMAFSRPTYFGITPRDNANIQAAQSEKFLECRAQTDGSRSECEDLTRKWARTNTAVLSIAFNRPEKKDSATLFMIEDRLWWAGREIK